MKPAGFLFWFCLMKPCCERAFLFESCVKGPAIESFFALPNGPAASGALVFLRAVFQHKFARPDFQRPFSNTGFSTSNTGFSTSNAKFFLTTNYARFATTPVSNFPNTGRQKPVFRNTAFSEPKLF
jgi:hypothetical protein